MCPLSSDQALELLQGDLSAQTKSMIESQEAYEELREKVCV